MSVRKQGPRTAPAGPRFRGMEKGGAFAPPCSRLLATVSLERGATLHVVEATVRRREVVERHVRDGEGGEHGGEHGERGEREVAGHFVLLVSS